jgi:hypothetical protein
VAATTTTKTKTKMPLERITEPPPPRAAGSRGYRLRLTGDLLAAATN